MSTLNIDMRDYADFIALNFKKCDDYEIRIKKDFKTRKVISVEISFKGRVKYRRVTFFKLTILRENIDKLREVITKRNDACYRKFLQTEDKRKFIENNTVKFKEYKYEAFTSL